MDTSLQRSDSLEVGPPLTLPARENLIEVEPKMLRAFRYAIKAYPEIEQVKDTNFLNVSRLKPEEIKALNIDIEFLKRYPNTRREHYFANFLTFRPRNETEDEALQILADSTKSANLAHELIILEGSPGVGKSHLCISIAKAAFKNCVAGYSDFLFFDDSNALQFQQKNQIKAAFEKAGEFPLIIIDDLNFSSSSSSTESFYLARILLQAKLHVFENGGLIVLTSNQPKIIEQVENSYCLESSEREKFKDRTKGLNAKIINITGQSHRSS